MYFSQIRQIERFIGKTYDSISDWIDTGVDCDGYVNVVDKVLVRNQFGQTGCGCPSLNGLLPKQFGLRH